MMTSPKLTKCFFNDRGYCKFREHCRKHHHKSVCQIKHCDKNCNARHPKLCKFKSKCKFNARSICAFKHVTSANEEDELNVLKQEIESLKQENRRKESELKRLVVVNVELNHVKDKNNHEDKIEILDNEKQDLKIKVSMLENENKVIKKELEVHHGEMIKKENNLEMQLIDYKAQVDALKDKVSDIQNINEHYKMEIKSRNIEAENRKVAFVTLEKEIQKMKSDLICNECDYKANTLPTFLIHMKKKHTEANNDFKLCKKCEFKSANEEDLKLHISVQHADSQNM